MAPSGSRAAPPLSQVTRSAAAKSAAKAPQKRASKPTAIVYVSAHCGDSGKTSRNVCQQATDELRERGVAFVERDIFDARYRDQYVEKMRSLGRRPPAVPLIDIEGHLVLGARGVLYRVIGDALAGAEPRVHHAVGLTKPPSPAKPVIEPGETWVEPSDSPAVLYGAKSCPHCPAARKLLNQQGVQFGERSQSTPKVRAEVRAHAKRFGTGGGTAPSFYIFGRFLEGVDYASIEALVHWRRGERTRSSAKRAAKATDKPTAIVYVSPYCGTAGTAHDVCQVAMDELRQNGVSFVKREIFDARYRDQYVRKMQSIGRRPPAVPLIDIEGRLVLGSDGSLHRVIFDARKGVQSRVRYPAGSTRPPSPLEHQYDPATTWVEPPDSPAIVYGAKYCPWCKKTRESLDAHGVETVERSRVQPTVRAEVEAHANRLGLSNAPAPSVYIFGWFVDGLDKASIEALFHWRRSERKQPSRATK